MGVAVVTGASSGLGKAFAEELSRKTGAVSEVWAIARDEKRLQALKASCPPGRLRIFPMDLTEKGAAEEIAGILKAEKKRISVLVNCAGFGKTGKVQELKAEEQSEICRLNAEALTSVTCHLLPFLRRGGKILEISSAAAFLPQPGFAVYAASKAYVLSFSRALAAELRGRGITVTAVCPGPVRTEFFLRASGKKEPEGLKKYFMAEPEKVVKKALADACRGKTVSVYGISMNVLRAAAKLIPHRIILAGFAAADRFQEEKRGKRRE